MNGSDTCTGRRALQYGLPGPSKYLLIESRQLAKVWVEAANKRGKQLSNTLTLRGEIDLHRILVQEGYDVEYIVNKDLSPEADGHAPWLGLEAAALDRRLKDHRLYLPLDAAKQYCDEWRNASENKILELEDLYSSNNSMGDDEEPEYAPSDGADFFPDLRAFMADSGDEE